MYVRHLGFSQPTLDRKVIAFGASLHRLHVGLLTLIQNSFPFDEMEGFYSWLLQLTEQ